MMVQHKYSQQQQQQQQKMEAGSETEGQPHYIAKVQETSLRYMKICLKQN